MNVVTTPDTTPTQPCTLVGIECIELENECRDVLTSPDSEYSKEFGYKINSVEAQHTYIRIVNLLCFKYYVCCCSLCFVWTLKKNYIDCVFSNKYFIHSGRITVLHIFIKFWSINTQFQLYSRFYWDYCQNVFFCCLRDLLSYRRIHNYLKLWLTLASWPKKSVI